MTEAPKEFVPDRWTLDQLKAAMSRGTRLCGEHNVMDNGRLGPDDRKAWWVCLAGLPESVEKFERRWELKSRYYSIDPQGWERAAGHRGVWVLDEEGASQFFNGPDFMKPNPAVHPVKKEMVFIRLDIARFTQFPEELQPRVIADVHELIFEQLTQTLGPDCLTSESKSEWRPERVLHTGDGFILAFSIPPTEAFPFSFPKPLELAKALAKVLDRRNGPRLAVHFRISVTLGPVYVTGDLKGQPNYVGHAITESERLLQCIPANQDDVVCFSDGVYRKYRERFHGMPFTRMGTISDKHQTMHRFYLMEYMG